MAYDFHYAEGLRGEYSVTGGGCKDDPKNFIKTYEVIGRYFDINQNTTYIDEFTVKAIVAALEAHYEECYLKLKANEAIKNGLYFPEKLYLKNEEVVWVYLSYRSSVAILEGSIKWYRKLLIPENRVLFFNYCMPNDIFKKYRDTMQYLHKNSLIANKAASPSELANFFKKLITLRYCSLCQYCK